MSEEPKCTCPKVVERTDRYVTIQFDERRDLFHEEMCDVHPFSYSLEQARKRGEEWARRREEQILGIIM